jgi:hypothetical protein
VDGWFGVGVKVILGIALQQSITINIIHTIVQISKDGNSLNLPQT